MEIAHSLYHSLILTEEEELRRAFNVVEMHTINSKQRYKVHTPERHGAESSPPTAPERNTKPVLLNANITHQL